MLIFHGSYVEIRQPRIIKGRYTKDFGPGFYCTTIKEQTIRWAKRYDTAIVNKFKHPTQQIAFCTERSVDCLQFILSEVVL
ncbi:MAG: DUF3990 domain-containing protein [Spirochaetaceae bacterium]|jgi:hypothetical protein|nr:DUF3990 domain-containing protein [Spirochaetaceae bacterium]